MAITPVIGLLCAAQVLVLLLIKYIVYPVFVSPLAQIPSAHWSASFTELWILWIRYSCQENRAIYRAHQRYGSIVRLGPNEVSVNTYGGLRTIYVGGYEKHAWYNNMFTNYDNVPTMFSTVQARPHSQRKRMISNLYSKSTLQCSKTLQAISDHIIFERLLPELVKREGQSVDVHFLFNRVTMDMVTAYLFGLCNSTNFIRDSDLASQWLHWFHCRKPYAFWVGELPRVLDWAQRIGLGRLVSPAFVQDANQRLGDQCLQMVDAAIGMPANREVESLHPENVPVIARKLHETLHDQVKKPGSLPLHRTASVRMQLASEAIDQLAAGHETSSITLTYLCWALAQRPDLQQALRNELMTLSPIVQIASDARRHTLPDARAIDDLPLLHAILIETMRCHPAIPGPEPRITPAGATLCGITNLPAGIRVSCSPYCLHRNAKVFERPEEFVPDRWLPGPPDDQVTKERLAEQYRWFWAFSSGGRMCIGSNFAVQEMKLIVASIFTNWSVKIVDDKGIEQEDAYTAQPVGHRLILCFQRWKLGEDD